MKSKALMSQVIRPTWPFHAPHVVSILITHLLPYRGYSTKRASFSRAASLPLLVDVELGPLRLAIVGSRQFNRATKQMRSRRRPTLRGWLDIAFTCQGFKGVENTLSHLSPAFTVTRMNLIRICHHLKFGSFFAALFYRPMEIVCIRHGNWRGSAHSE
jgi:hypothetical protein